MSGLFALSFTTPWLLIALLGLPAIWWLLRVTPPAPERVSFPAIRLILGAQTEEESPAHTPWWVLLMRLLIAALVILALAGPVWNAARPTAASGPMVIIIDNSWAAARDWEVWTRTIRELTDDAEQSGRGIVVIPTAPRLSNQMYSLSRASEAREFAASLAPMPFLADHGRLLSRISELRAVLEGERADVIWLSDNIESEHRQALAEGLAEFGDLSIYRNDTDFPPMALSPVTTERNGLLTTVRRPVEGALAAGQGGQIRAVGASGRTLTRVPFEFAEDEAALDVLIELPLELRNEATRLEIEGLSAAGAISLIDDASRRRAVGLVNGANAYDDQPLLSETFYLNRALEPFADLREGAVGDLIDSGVAVLVLADVGRLSGDDYTLVREWVESGGVLIRFAGPRLAAQADDLLPIGLRSGDRALGGALAWSTPQGLLPFEDSSPFAGLDVSEDVQVTHQVLAEPELELAEKTWARLSDGTPLVTGARRAQGWAVLFHVTANQDWSNLAASGLYVEMLRRLLRLSTLVSDLSALGDGRALLPPITTLDGYGRLQQPPPTAEPLTADALRGASASPRHPPGLYGAEDAARSLNVLDRDEAFGAAGMWPVGATLRTFRSDGAMSIKPALLTAALLLFLADMVVGLIFAGHLRLGRIAQAVGRTAATPMIAALLLATALPGEAHAQDEDVLTPEEAWAINAVSELHLAYVLTGDQSSDEMAHAGLAGLTRTLFARTTVEPAEPIGVDLENDELAFFPILYWRVSPNQSVFSADAIDRLAQYMQNGGTVLIDTADSGSAASVLGPSESTETMRRILEDLDVPPLIPVPDGHVLTRAFYLLSEFPGRWADADLWVEAPNQDGRTFNDRDGVSPIIIGSNDYAAAWATDDSGRPLASVTPGGADQREMANRFGVNLVMYALTGNYKADQVHIPALLERLGQ